MSKINFFQGVVLSNIVNKHDVYLTRYKGNNSSYIVNQEIGLYIKYCQNRISPWSFSFSEEHVGEIEKINKEFLKCYLVLVCNQDGICCLDYKEYSNILSVESSIYPKWIKASRLRGEKYMITGSDGKLGHKIGNSDFPNKIFK